MTARFKPHHPEHYPVAWNSAARQALAAPGTWVSADWARGRAGAVSRMKRMRAFRDGLVASPQAIPGTAEALANGLTLAFRAVEAWDAWDVQLRWAPAKPSADGPGGWKGDLARATGTLNEGLK